MNLDQAQALRAALDAAIAAAQAAGRTEVDLTASLQADDDAARAELQAAIAQARAREAQPRGNG